MFAHLQGTTKLKAVSRLLGRTPRLQARLAQAESPVCRHISTFPIVAALTLHLPLFLFALINCSMVWIFFALYFSCFSFHHRWQGLGGVLFLPAKDLSLGIAL